MSILAINLGPQIQRELRERELKHRLAVDVQQALKYLEDEDFYLVIEDTRRAITPDQDLNLLLAATPPGTTICALVSNLWLPETEYWQAQGIRLFFGEARNLIPELIQ